MYNIEDVVELIADGGLGTVGVDLFAYHAPADARNCIIVYPSNDPPLVDELNPYFKGRFQVIVRNSEHVAGVTICKEVTTLLTLFDVDTANIKIKRIRPLHQARVYRRSNSGMIEFSVNYDIRFALK